jgi:tetratricopeptide (TPR) repeat protein
MYFLVVCGINVILNKAVCNFKPRVLAIRVNVRDKISKKLTERIRRIKHMRILLLLLLNAFPLYVLGQHSGMKMPAETKQVMPEVGLGKVDHPVSTKNALAQKFFDQGMSYIYGFNHDEAVRSFKHAAELDPDLAMAYWGVALARGSNYNAIADLPQLTEAWENLQKAVERAPKASASDQAYIRALSVRYDGNPLADQSKLAAAYKTAMGELVKQFPNDLDAATLYAESMMNLKPWQLWSLDGKPAEGTLEIVSVLESVLKRNPLHPGANHYYIHAVEASPNPERALPSARRMGLIAPNAGHLVHMPSHIYIRTGDYAEAAKVNANAIIVDQNYMKKTGAQGLYIMMYYNHNIHFLASANTMNGRYADAIRGSRELEANVRPNLSEMPMLQAPAVYPIVTLIRFHKWDELQKYPEPAASLKVVAAFRHFGVAMAFAETGKTADAEKEMVLYRDATKAVPADLQFDNNAAPAVLKIAGDLLGGEILLSRGDKKAAIKQLTDAVADADTINYDEPPDWDLPVREWLGRALLMDGQYAEAEKVYRAELVKHPHNGRALFGLAESLQKQKKTVAAQKVRLEFARAWARADTKLRVEDLYH